MKFKDVLKEGFGKEIIIYGIKKGDPDYMSDIIMVWPKGKPKPNEKQMEKIKEIGKKKGYDRFDVRTVDLSTPPDFKKAINV